MPRIIQYLARELHHSISVIGIFFKNVFHVTQVVILSEDGPTLIASLDIIYEQGAVPVTTVRSLRDCPISTDRGTSHQPHAENTVKDFGYRKSQHYKGSPQENDV